MSVDWIKVSGLLVVAVVVAYVAYIFLYVGVVIR